MTISWPLLTLLVLLAAAAGAAFSWLAATGRSGAREAQLRGERDLLAHREADLADRLELVAGSREDDRAVAAALAPLREAMTRVERQVGLLERDRVEQYGSLAERLSEVGAQAGALRAQTAALTGALNASTVRGAWGEAQLRRVCEHAGMLPRCDFEEQVSAVTSHGKTVRPDLVVHLPGQRCLVVDAKAPLAAFLAAQADGVSGEERTALMREHARALRGHVDELAGKRYWSAFDNAPELVVCFVPADAMLAAALSADPGLYDAAAARKVVLASPATLLTLLRTAAYAWRQDALTSSARELLALGDELYARLGTLGGHLTRMGSSLRRSVETYNSLVGTLETRVLVTARKMHDLGLAGDEPTETTPVEATPRPLTAAELIDAVEAELAPDDLDARDLALPSPDARPSAHRRLTGT
ncbi:MAG: DNA recombination protein RmuC [Dermatophilaceae bacterium]